jgi:hypothetical protein
MEQDYFMRVWAWLAGFAASGSVNRADIWLVTNESDQLNARNAAENWIDLRFCRRRSEGCWLLDRAELIAL